jgi:hypothetical protein
MISEGDRRSLRANRVRAHIRGCDGCQAFEFATSNRSRGFASLLPIAVFTGGPSGLMGFLGFGRLLRRSAVLAGRSGVHCGRPRLQDIALRGLSAPTGIRGAGVTALLAAGGGVSALQLASPPRDPWSVTPAAPVVVRHAVAPGHQGRALPGGVRISRRTRAPRVEVAAGPKSSRRSVSGAPGPQIAPTQAYSSSASTPTGPSGARPSVGAQVPSGGGGANMPAGVTIGTSAGSTHVQVGLGPAHAQVSTGKAGVAVNAAVPVGSLAAAVGVTVGGGSTPVTVRMSVSLPSR